MTDEDRIAEAMRLADGYASQCVRRANGEAVTAYANRAALEAHLRAALAPAAPDLYGQIMNLPCKPPVDELRNPISMAWAYAIGHRDARHAAAELILAARAPQEGAGEKEG